MKLFDTKKIYVNKAELKITKNKVCCKCGEDSNNTITYTEKDIICMNCYCELIAKDRRARED